MKRKAKKPKEGIVPKVSLEYFDDIYSFINVINSRPRNKYISEDFSSRTGQDSWFGTKTYADANEILSKGWDVGAQTLKSMTKGVEIPTRTVHKSPKGFSPSVPDALAGKPKSMFDVKQINKKSNTINIFICSTCRASKTHKIIEIGAIAINVVNALEGAGIRCNIYSSPFASVGPDRTQVICAAVKIKNANQPLNLKKVAYPIGHISWFRRQGFRYLESCPDIIDPGFNEGYGSEIWDIPEAYNEMMKEIERKTPNCVMINYNVCEECGWNSQRVLDDAFEQLKKINKEL